MTGSELYTILSNFKGISILTRSSRGEKGDDTTHEETFVAYLKEHGFTQVFNLDEVVDNTFIWHPYESQSPPDIIICIQNVKFSIELKSNKRSSIIMWNGHIPKDNFIYLFSRLKNGEVYDTALFLGDSVKFDAKEEALALWERQEQESKELELKFSKDQVAYWPRPQYQDRKFKALKHVDRPDRALRVLNFIERELVNATS